ncbi:hypothetical protein Val02_30910 [Virgisporangium aliadipatigenens]|uniref:Uncharacterized protein n=1 Tax=Virgisporangium aliadipatigenens TaxID=741659 RepID=A0A8J3YLL8_9ACTN|nr:hypothetical protein Val02_30910 [Virgisporangium aliadipatigenens]
MPEVADGLLHAALTRWHTNGIATSRARMPPTVDRSRTAIVADPAEPGSRPDCRSVSAGSGEAGGPSDLLLRLTSEVASERRTGGTGRLAAGGQCGRLIDQMLGRGLLGRKAVQQCESTAVYLVGYEAEVARNG